MTNEKEIFSLLDKLMSYINSLKDILASTLAAFGAELVFSWISFTA
jgi:hypothetical protein